MKVGRPPSGQDPWPRQPQLSRGETAFAIFVTFAAVAALVGIVESNMWWLGTSLWLVAAGYVVGVGVDREDDR